MSQGDVLELNMGSKWGPNRIFDAEGVRKPLDRHLGGYHSALGAILAALGRILKAIRSPKEGTTPSDLATADRPQATGPYIRDSQDKSPVQASRHIKIPNRVYKITLIDFGAVGKPGIPAFERYPNPLCIDLIKRHISTSCR